MVDRWLAVDHYEYLESHLNALYLAVAATESGLSGDTWALLIGGGIFIALMIGLLVTLSYTNVGNRHQAKPEPHDIHRQTKVHETKH